MIKRTKKVSKQKAAASPRGASKTLSTAALTRMYATSTPKKPATQGRKALSGTSVTIQFGSVIVEARGLSKTKVRENVKAGHTALERAKNKIVQGGVKLNTGSDIPLFRADPETPNRLVRDLNGKLDYGTFVNGKFKPSAA